MIRRWRFPGNQMLIPIVLSLFVFLVFSSGCQTIPSFQASPASPNPAKPPVPSGELNSQNANSTAVTVTRVVDGDTVEVSFAGTTYTVRYIGIDAPETVAPNRPIEPYGREASSRNTELVLGKAVRLEKDVSETDKYGRLLRYVYVGDLFVNAELVRGGYAQAISYPPDIKYQSLFLQLQNEARMAGRGLWGIAE